MNICDTYISGGLDNVIGMTESTQVKTRYYWHSLALLAVFHLGDESSPLAVVDEIHGLVMVVVQQEGIEVDGKPLFHDFQLSKDMQKNI